MALGEVNHSAQVLIADGNYHLLSVERRRAAST